MIRLKPSSSQSGYLDEPVSPDWTLRTGLAAQIIFGVFLYFWRQVDQLAKIAAT